MSIAELQAELQTLSPAQLAQVESTIQQFKLHEEPERPPFSEFVGCGRGLMNLLPGWDEDEPLEMWDALRNDSSF